MMEEKIIDFEVPINTLAQQYPDFVDTMYSIGFTKIKVPGMLGTVGKIINLKKGSRAMGIPLETIAKAFEERGYQLKNYDK
ncbi:DUF1858 domain-containing protein [Companilactobacillus sp.]|uniref:DUF1858 domain-containing protein n=2 Tax=Companilactobacillus sp. TaxID=2767905 RepID=UPI002612EF2C|nr:DUF1858 domain-containing protein [Companilactobacillus sp.]